MEEQGLVARLIHRLKSAHPGQHFALLQAARNRFSAGGARRLKHTLPPIAFSALHVVRHLCLQAGAPDAAAAAPSPKEVSIILPIMWHVRVWPYFHELESAM